MGTDERTTFAARMNAGIALGKDLIALLRDGSLLLVALLLVAFPARLNAILVQAGFKEGSLAGFRWQSNLEDSNQALEEARQKLTELQKVNDEQAKVLAEAKTHLPGSGLQQRITQLEQDHETQKASTNLVQKSVEQTIQANVNLVQQAQPSRPLSDYAVGLQTFGFPEETRIALNGKLSAEGYGLDPNSGAYLEARRPDWFAPRPTVFYYAASALPAAQRLAGFLKAETHQDFAVQRGAGLGVDPARREVTFFVHLLKP